MSGGKAQGFSSAILNLIFQATTITVTTPSGSGQLAINGTSGQPTQLWVSLHTSSPGASGNQSTNEAAYPSYARQSVVRSSSGFTTSSGGSAVQFVSNLSFPTSTGSPSETETYFGIGTDSSTAGTLLYFGPLSSSIAVTSAGITPQLTTTTSISEA